VIQNGANLGFAKANNRGINYALATGADYIMLLTNDTVVDPGFLEPLLAAFESDVEVGFASSKIYYYDRPTIVWFFGGEINWQTGWAYHYNPNQEDTSGVYNGLRATPIVTGCCLMARRAVLEQVGLLDPRFFAYYEDTDWSVRATRAGYKGVVVAQSHIWHKVSASAKDKKVTTGTFLFVRNGLLFTRKHARGQPLVALRFTLQWVIKPSIRGALRREAFWFRLMLLRIAAVLAHCCRCYYAVPAIVQQLATVGEDRRSAL
jgi:GT2 family glycosyltransferase